MSILWYDLWSDVTFTPSSSNALLLEDSTFFLQLETGFHLVLE